MNKLILKIYNLRSKHYMKLWKKAMDGMEKHMLDIDGSKFKKYAKRNYKFRIRFEKIREKRSKLLKTWR